MILSRLQRCGSDSIGEKHATVSGRRRCDNMNDFVHQLHAVIHDRQLSNNCIYIVRVTFSWVEQLLFKNCSFCSSDNFWQHCCSLVSSSWCNFFALFLVHPEMIGLGVDLCYTIFMFFKFIFYPRISQLCQVISAKFCTVVWLEWVLKIKLSISGHPPATNFRGQKHAKCGSISDHFKLWRRLSPEQMKIFKIGQVFDLQRFLPCSAKKSKSTVNFGRLNSKI